MNRKKKKKKSEKCNIIEEIIDIFIRGRCL